MSNREALDTITARAQKAPFTATGFGPANQRARGIVAGTMVEVNVRGEQVRYSVHEAGDKLMTREVVEAVLTGAIAADAAPCEMFHAA